MTTQAQRIDALEQRLASVERMLVKVLSDEPSHQGAYTTLMGLTSKQHAVLQMLLSGRSNAEIAARLDIETSTAKVHVRSLTRKLEVAKRTEVAAKVSADFFAIPDEAYLTLSGGLPKTWDQDYDPKKKCPFRHVYMGGSTARPGNGKRRAARKNVRAVS